jgi:hypothetical protein
MSAHPGEDHTSIQYKYNMQWSREKIKKSKTPTRKTKKKKKQTIKTNEKSKFDSI